MKTRGLDAWAALQLEIDACRRCARLARWRVEAARRAPRSHRGKPYWSKPVPCFGPASARLLIVGLAPGAHGANRTGRPFTGDGAGAFLYAALHRHGFASCALSTGRDDALRLFDARITNAVRCAPPGNRPSVDEIEHCHPFLRRELELTPATRVILCLGALAWASALRVLGERGALPRPKPRFGHAACFDPGDGRPVLLGSYHPSQLNTRTGRLTAEMFDDVMSRARAIVDCARAH